MKGDFSVLCQPSVWFYFSLRRRLLLKDYGKYNCRTLYVVHYWIQQAKTFWDIFIDKGQGKRKTNKIGSLHCAPWNLSSIYVPCINHYYYSQGYSRCSLRNARTAESTSSRTNNAVFLYKQMSVRNVLYIFFMFRCTSHRWHSFSELQWTVSMGYFKEFLYCYLSLNYK